MAKHNNGNDINDLFLDNIEILCVSCQSTVFNIMNQLSLDLPE